MTHKQLVTEACIEGGHPNYFPAAPLPCNSYRMNSPSPSAPRGMKIGYLQKYENA